MDKKQKFSRLPLHIGVIPDGNRRWALTQGLDKHEGYHFGIKPGLELYDACLKLGIKEMTIYGFTSDNTKRPAQQIEEFRSACVDAVSYLSTRDAYLLVVGNYCSPLFPQELLPYTQRTKFGKGLIKVNFLVNYSWKWDLNNTLSRDRANSETDITKHIASSEISRIDLIIRWGGRSRLSGFLPIQSIYADIFVLDALWPDFQLDHFYQALTWYQDQDITLGG